jgi:hypothetical protein
MAERALLVIGRGLFVGVLGGLIRDAGMMYLIAGYDPDQIADDKGLANFIGAHTLIVAVLTVCIGVLELWELTGDSMWYWVGFVTAIVALAVRMVRGARQYHAPLEPNQTS